MKKLLCTVCVLVVAVVTLRFWAPAVVENHYNRVLARPPYAIPAPAAALQQKLFVADLHADTLLWGRNLLKRGTSGHVDLPRLQQANVSLQFFTVVTTIPRKLNIERNSSTSDLIRYLSALEGWPLRTWTSPKERALYQAARLQHFASDSEGELVVLRTRSDLQTFLADRDRGRYKLAALLGAEGAQPLEGTLENLDVLYAAGYRMMAPTHFTDTEIGGSASGPSKSGLTNLGRQWVRQMEAKSMLIDLAHASPATLRDVTSLATKPVIVSHTGVRGTCDNNRNLSDDELRAVAQTGGIIGIGYWETATCGIDAEAVARAISYAIEIAGVEHVALGSDFDGSTTMPFDATGVPLITAELLARGFSEHDIRLVMGENVLRVLSQTLPN